MAVCKAAQPQRRRRQVAAAAATPQALPEFVRRSEHDMPELHSPRRCRPLARRGCESAAANIVWGDLQGSTLLKRLLYPLTRVEGTRCTSPRVPRSTADAGLSAREFFRTPRAFPAAPWGPRQATATKLERQSLCKRR